MRTGLAFAGETQAVAIVHAGRNVHFQFALHLPVALAARAARRTAAPLVLPPGLRAFSTSGPPAAGRRAGRGRAEGLGA